MTNPAGTRWETEIVRYMQDRGHLAVKRAAKTGAKDEGDLINIEDLTVEAKARKSIDLAQGVSQATIEAVNAGTAYFVAVFKRRYRRVRDAYAVTTLANYLDMLEELLRLRRENQRLREQIERMAA